MAIDYQQTPPEVLQQAAYWVVVLYTFEDPTPFFPSYATWLNETEENNRAFLRMEQIWRDLDALYVQGRLTNPIPEMAVARQSPPRKRFGLPWFWCAFVVCVLTFVVIGAFPLSSGTIASRFGSVGAFFDSHGSSALHPASCRAPAGHPEVACPLSEGQHASDYEHMPVLDLTDGSVVVLNTNSQVTLDFTPGHRRVQLDRGEALFRVKKNEEIPFEVPVGSTTVESVGTVFTVEKKPRGTTEVVVQEGEVRLHTKERAQAFALNEGQTADVDHGDIHLRPAAVSRLDGRASWVTGVVSLNGDTLAEAAEKFNPYNRRQLVVDAEIASLPVEGIFSSTNPDEFAQALEQLRGIHHSLTRDPQTGAEIIRLSKKPLPSDSHITGDGNRLADRH